MGKINVGRWILCGVVAGVVGDIIESLITGLWLGKSWNAAMEFLGKPALTSTQIIEFNVVGW